jgi:hypothetical protein
MGEFLPESRDGFEIARQFEKSGIDLLNISFGMTFPESPVPEGFICKGISRKLGLQSSKNDGQVPSALQLTSCIILNGAPA